jgi:peptidoglycan-N-acetylglucosamine deacetylase
MPPRYRTGQQRAGRFSRYDLTRRGLLGLGALLTGVGVADFLRRPGKHPATATLDSSPTTSLRGTTPTRPGHHGPSGTTSASPTSGTTTGPTVAGTPTSLPTHPDTGGTSSVHGTGGTDINGHPGARTRRYIDDHVTLPTSAVQVRDRPVYYLDQLVPDAPKHAIALTIDDGPSYEYTPKVLRLLDRHRMQASFCVVGHYADLYPNLIRDIHRAGHVIVNHTYTHVLPFSTQTQKRIVDEITRTQRSIEKAAKVTPQLFRSPGGDWSPFIFKAVAAYDLIPLDWDIDPDDWQLPGTKRIAHRMLQGRPNDIVLCHDGGGDRAETVRALRKVLPAWRRRGYTTVALVPPAKDFPPPTPPSPPPATPSASPSTAASTSPTP